MPKEEKESKRENFTLDVEEMIRAGLHFGHKTTKLHPQMKPYLYGVRNTVHIIDLEKTAGKFKEALEFIKELAKEKKVMLLVGTKIPHRELVKNVAKECNLPYVSERWLGGSLTNFQVIKKRIDYLKELEEKRSSEDFAKYTKKERFKIEEEIGDLEKKFGGIKELEELPDAVFVCDMKKDSLSIKEARMKGIKVIGICDTNADPTLADYPIPANDDAISSVKYILEKVKEVILKTKEKSG